MIEQQDPNEMEYDAHQGGCKTQPKLLLVRKDIYCSNCWVAGNNQAAKYEHLSE